MFSRFQLLQGLCHQINPQLKFKLSIKTQLINPLKTPHFFLSICNFHLGETHNSEIPSKDHHNFSYPEDENSTKSNDDAIKVQNLLKNHENSSNNDLDHALDRCGIALSDDLVINILRRHFADWKPAYRFFNWVSRGENRSDFSPGSCVYNQILDILGKMKRFHELNQVLDEMSKRKGLANEKTFEILLNRYAAAHKIEETIEIFYKRIEFGLELDLIAFNTLLMSLCRYKHVEAAEFLFHSKKNEFEFEFDIRTRNIILNGWCVLGSLREAKRFWNDIISSKCKPDLFTYGTFINSLSKAGKLGTAVKLFRAMWKKGCNPDVVICNCIIDGLCFKERIPEALEIFGEMNCGDCAPNVATYNSLIKHLCKIMRMDKVYKLLDEMERKNGGCSPNATTYGYLIKSAKSAEEVDNILKRMEKNGCSMTSDSYNLVLKLFMNWGLEERAKSTWIEMERSGMGPDQRSYTVMIHGYFEKERIDEALGYFSEMMAKGMVPEPRTKVLVKAMNIKLMETEGKSGVKEKKARNR